MIIVAAALRVPRLGESLWYDELAAWMSYGAHGPWVIVSAYHDPANQIAHTLLSWCSVMALAPLLGDELALRFPALLFSLLSVPAVYALAWRVTRSHAGALVAAALLAAMPVAVLQGADARSYSMMICLAALTNWTWLSAIEDGRRRWWIGWACLSAIGVWAHLMFIFVPIAHGAWTAWRSWRAGDSRLLRRDAFACALAGALTILLYAPVVTDLLRLRDEFRSIEGDEPRILGVEGWHAVLQLGGSWTWWAAAPGLGLLVVGMVAIARDRRRRSAAAIMWLPLPLAVASLAVAGSWMYARFTLFALPAAAVTIAIAIAALWRRQRWLAIAAGGALIGGYAADVATRPPRQPLRDAVEYVAARAPRGTRVGTIGLHIPVIDYYGRRAGLAMQDSGLHGTHLSSMLESHRPEWVIVYYPLHVSAERFELLESRGFTRERTFSGWIDWGGGDVVVFRRDEDVALNRGAAPPPGPSGSPSSPGTDRR